MNVPTTETSQRMVRAILQVIDERARQDQKWGEQNHPDAPEDRASLGIAANIDARLETDEALERGRLTWAHIAIEELSGAIYAPTDSERRRELVQLAAVAIAWIECIDRRRQIPSVDVIAEAPPHQSGN